MGVLSTMEITREDALKELKRAMARLGEMSDVELEDLMKEFYAEKTGHNFSIVKIFDEDVWQYREGCLGE